MSGTAGKWGLRHAVMDEIVKDFLTESTENLERLDQERVRLESGSPTSESLANMVRAVHTIKGGAGFLGFPHIERVTRAGESLLARLRDGHLSPDVSSGVVTMAGAVRHMLGEIESTGHDGENDYPDLLARLSVLASAASAGSR